MSRKKGSDDGAGDGERMIAGAVGLVIGFILLWLIVGYAWEAVWM